VREKCCWIKPDRFLVILGIKLMSWGVVFCVAGRSCLVGRSSYTAHFHHTQVALASSADFITYTTYTPDPFHHIHRPTQSMICVPLQLNGFQKFIYLLLSTNIWNHFIFQNLILRTRLCGAGFINLTSCVFDFRLTEICQAEIFCIGGVTVLKRHFGGAGP